MELPPRIPKVYVPSYHQNVKLSDNGSDDSFPKMLPHIQVVNHLPGKNDQNADKFHEEAGPNEIR